MVNLSLVALTLTGASLVAAHSGVKADGGPAHLKMISKVNKRSSSSKCSGSTRARKSYKNRHASSPSSSSSAQDAGTSAKAPQVKAVKNEQQSTTASKVFSTEAPKSNPTTTSAKAAETTYSTGTSAGDSTGKGMFGVSGPCGDSGAVNTPTNDNGPNGSEDWLNCGVSSGGWNPPSIKLDQIKVLSLDAAVAMDNSVFSACAPYLDHFDKIGNELGIPPILLASFAMQESSCDASVMGDNGGAYGLMQITEDKCGDAPGGDCTNVDYNIRRGAEYFASTLSDNGGNLLKALGTYNGWYEGLTTSGAMKIRTTCFACQQNLDYFQQLLNGWMQGLDGSKMGNVRNLDQ